MALVKSSRFAHVRLTLTDIARSKAFYDQVFGWPAAIDASDKAGDPGVAESPEEFFGGIIYQTPQGNHVSFAVDSRDELVRAAEAMAGAGIEHGDIIDMTDAGVAILSFQDPDAINIELTAPLA